MYLEYVDCFFLYFLVSIGVLRGRVCSLSRLKEDKEENGEDDERETRCSVGTVDPQVVPNYSACSGVVGDKLEV
jgi:hypothetical protein